jgi:RNA polymerase sigma-70 factor (ECF subfamily)
VKPETRADPSNRAMTRGAARPSGAHPGAPESAPGPAAAGSEERALVERARRGEEEAFRMLVDLHRDRAYGLALRITRSRDDAEDVAQEAFVRAWLALPRFRGESSFGTWLHRIVARRAVDRAVTLQARRRREAEPEAGDAVPAPAPGASRDVLLCARLERLIARLSPAQRAAVSLFYLEDRPVEEIARTLEMPENTVKTHLSRARATLRAAWLAEGGAPA